MTVLNDQRHYLAAFARLDVEHRLVFNLMAREIARTGRPSGGFEHACVQYCILPIVCIYIYMYISLTPARSLLLLNMYCGTSLFGVSSC